jgi:hypothetical protein
MLREVIMTPFSEVLVHQLNDLEMSYKALAHRVREAAELLEIVGRPVPQGHLREFANSAQQFEEIKRVVLKLSESVSGLPPTPELGSIKDLRSFMESVSNILEAQTAHRINQQAACAVLDKVLTITHVDGTEFAPLLQCQEEARKLRDRIAETAWPVQHPDTEDLVRGKHIFSELVKFVSFHDELDDEEWERLQNLVSNMLGKPMGLAASRGKLTMSSSAPPPPQVPVSVTQPATAVGPKEEPAAQEKGAADAIPAAGIENPGEGSNGEKTSAPVGLTADPPAPTPPVASVEAVADPADPEVSGGPAPEPVEASSPSDPTSTDQLPASAAPDVSGTVAMDTTFEGTIDDIRYMLVLDLIDGKGVAKVLSNKISAASNAALGGDRERAEKILKAFIDEVNAQTGKHISGAAPQLLLKDANGLLSQLLY